MTNSPHIHGTAISHMFRTLNIPIDSKSAEPQFTTIEASPSVSLSKPDNLVVQAVCGHSETLLFLGFPNGYRTTVSLPNLTVETIQEKLVSLRRGTSRGGMALLVPGVPSVHSRSECGP